MPAPLAALGANAGAPTQDSTSTPVLPEVCSGWAVVESWCGRYGSGEKQTRMTNTPGGGFCERTSSVLWLVAATRMNVEPVDVALGSAPIVR